LAIDAVSGRTGKRTLHAAFLDWMQILRQYIEAGGDYLERAEKSFAGEINFMR
jgi:hypothetical protein